MNGQNKEIKEYDQTKCDFKSIHPKENCANKNISYMNYRELYDKLALSEFSIEINDMSFRNIYSSIRNNKSLPMHSFNCGAHSNMHVFDPYGDIYACVEFVGNKKYIIGNYKKSLIWDDTNLNIWRRRNIGTVDQCKKCKYALYCGGGCFAKHLTRGGELNSSFCNHFPYVFRSNVKRAYNEMFCTK